MTFLRPTGAILRSGRRPIPSALQSRPLLRYTSLSQQAFSSSAKPPASYLLRRTLVSTAFVALIGLGYISTTDSRSSLHNYLVPPLLRIVFSGDDISRPGPEAVHTFGLRFLSTLHSIGIPVSEGGDHPYLPTLNTTLFGFPVNTPLGISAGLDKHGEAIDALFTTSPAISMLEIGCVTPLPQAGNPKPRVFRVPSSKSLINRYGFNSVGAATVASRLRTRVRKFANEHGLTEAEVLSNPEIPASLHPGRILAVQIGKNKTTDETDIEAVKRDYVECVNQLGNYADLIVVNVSSPNTPGLRSLQAEKPLESILSAVVDATKGLERARKPQVVVKVSPDSDSPSEITAIANAVKHTGVKGVIVANTTVRRPSEALGPLATDEEKRVVAEEAGGLSGPVLFPRMLNLVEQFNARLRGSGVDVIACGGVQDGKDAALALRSGAKGVLAYTGLVYGGVGWFGKVANELAEIKEGLITRK
ncbi:FMN-linked oxidoreductase [Ascodesmis nigricans]|uniref:FMN-linked oxidoreductase n=1 Tax=Ascodesmis nigricans TaxID=341454 RepID=A0A4S2N419_9PEZI|nr:FMN-linked oxidoreductase [Ascodesmis nigricans]